MTKKQLNPIFNLEGFERKPRFINGFIIKIFLVCRNLQRIVSITFLAVLVR